MDSARLHRPAREKRLQYDPICIQLSFLPQPQHPAVEKQRTAGYDQDGSRHVPIPLRQLQPEILGKHLATGLVALRQVSEMPEFDANHLDSQKPSVKHVD
jgi:hypothetical protein